MTTACSLSERSGEQDLRSTRSLTSGRNVFVGSAHGGRVRLSSKDLSPLSKPELSCPLEGIGTINFQRHKSEQGQATHQHRQYWLARRTVPLLHTPKTGRVRPCRTVAPTYLLVRAVAACHVGHNQCATVHIAVLAIQFLGFVHPANLSAASAGVQMVLNNCGSQTFLIGISATSVYSELREVPDVSLSCTDLLKST